MFENRKVPPGPLPLLPTTTFVLLPHEVVPVEVYTPKSIEALDKSLASSKFIIFAPQMDPAAIEPELSRLHQIGTVAQIEQEISLHKNHKKILVEGRSRVRITEDIGGSDSYFVRFEFASTLEDDRVSEELFDSLKSTLQDSTLPRDLVSEILASIAGVTQPSQFADRVLSCLKLDRDEKLRVLELIDARARLDYALQAISRLRA